MKVRLRWTMPARKDHAAAPSQDFHCSLAHVSRVAVLMPGFRETKQVHVFADGFTAQAADYSPEAIAGSVRTLRALARTVQAGELQLPSLEFAVIVLTEMDGQLLSQPDRDLLWDTFGVPVYEQLLGPRLETLAAECPAHHGLHVIHPDCPTEHVATMLAASVETGPCACGEPGARLVSATAGRAPACTLQAAATRTA